VCGEGKSAIMSQTTIMETQLILQIGFLLAFVGALLFAAAHDALTYTIPNGLALAIAVAFPVAAILAFTEVAWLSHLAAAGIVLVLGTVLFRMGLFGGGDIKLWAAVALWTGLGALLYQAICITLLGGAMGLLAMLGRAILSRWGARLSISLERLPRVLRPKGAIPYGVAIAGGAILSIPRIAEFHAAQVILQRI
jgi:prepilin peptidase CpaA